MEVSMLWSTSRVINNDQIRKHFDAFHSTSEEW